MSNHQCLNWFHVCLQFFSVDIHRGWGTTQSEEQGHMYLASKGRKNLINTYNTLASKGIHCVLQAIRDILSAVFSIMLVFSLFVAVCPKSLSLLFSMLTES